ncbi:Copia protein [Trachymyrmex cornetzi]|uniref:Copia protein n=1 Tax=Trachymyrmex cornetzi TaxID=471704 RepID=A0A151IWP6_9HYME|nr:Copia protein [Trachymyrmex cornetzi]
MSETIDLKNVTKFDGTNFQLWKFQIKTILTTSGLINVTDKALMKPEPVAADYATWNTRNAKAMCILSSAMEYSQLEFLVTCETAAEMWAKLSSIHEQKSAANKLTLMTKFHEYKMASNDSVAQHVAKIENMARQLKDVDEELSEVMIMAKILGTLPQRFNPLITAWDSVSETNRTRDNLIERLLIEEGRLASFEEATNALAAVKIQRKSDSKCNASNSKKEAQQGKQAGHNKKEMFCQYCRKKGHDEKRCYKKRDDTRNKKKALNLTKDDATEFGAFIVSNSEFVSRIMQDDPSQVWILDSGASRHMSFHRE